MDDSKDISFSNLTDTISVQDYNYSNTIDLTDLSIGITMASPVYTMSNITTTTTPTISIGGVSGANVGYSNTKWTTGLSGTSAADLNQSGKLSLQGTNADIDINGKSLMKTLEALEERLNMMVPNPELEKEWDQLRKLGARYRKLEKQCQEKSKMWNKLKSMPSPKII